MIKIRTCRRSDLAKVSALWPDSVGYCRKPAENKISLMLCDSEKGKYEEDARLIIAEEDEHLIAIGSYIKGGDKIAELTVMEVHPKYRDRGLHQILMESLEERALNDGLRGFYHKTGDNRCQARGIWCDLGFTERESEMEGSEQYTVYEKLF